MVKFGATVLVLALGLGACASKPGEPSGAAIATPDPGCIDQDRDGYGEGCGTGHDCDDSDRAVTQDCLRCAQPSEGCPCADGSEPQVCGLSSTFDSEGEKLCHEGTRYCREGVWSVCESVVSYRLSERLEQQALIDPDAGPERCSDCAIDCFIVRDNLDPIDGGLGPDNSSQLGWAPGGGLTLAPIPDAGAPPVVDAGVFDPSKCMKGVAPDIDCDGIPDEFDPYPDDPPFATANPAIFLDIAPGEIGTGIIDLSFFLNSADIYFLLDQTNSMTQERDTLKEDLVSGTFVDADFDCADGNFDFMPDNDLKDDGIIGAIRCIIRDSNFGVGFFREIPFNNYGPSGRLDEYIAFESYSDITSDIDDVVDAIALLNTDGNTDWEEAAGPALHNLVTGSGMYFGTKLRGVPPRTDCPGTAWGYPCFRDGAIPIVIMFTDAQMHNGPSNNAFPYNATNLGLTAGTGANYTPLAATNESFASVVDLGDLTSSIKTFTGNTTKMTADLPASYFGSCLSDSGGYDAVFKFNLTQQKTVQFSSEGSRFDTVLGLFTGAPASPTALMASNNTNEIGSNAYAIGNMFGRSVTVTGNTSTMAADMESAALGCDAAHTAPDAVYSFSLSQATRVGIGTQGSALDTVLALHSGQPVVAPTYTAVPSTNEDFTAPAVLGDAYNNVRAASGNTNTMLSDFSNAQVGCNSDNASPDSVVKFNLTTPTRVRISTEGSGYDTVIGLFDDAASAVGVATVAATNETQSTAYSIGTVDDKIFQLSGSTSSMRADYGGAVVGCNADTAAKDAVFKFTLTAPRDVQIDTIGSSFDTVIALYGAAFDLSESQATNNANGTYATAMNLGTANGRSILVTGGNTTNMADNYDKNFVGCSYHNTAPEAAFRFSLSQATEVKLDTTGSAFDTVLSLFSSEPAATQVNLPNNSNDTQATAHDVGAIDDVSKVFVGNNMGLAGNYDVGCSATSTAADAVLKFTVNTAGNYEFSTTGTTFDSVLGLYPSTVQAANPATPTQVNVAATNNTVANARNMGVLDDGWFRYRGDTSTTLAKWTDLQCGADSGAEDAFFRFTLNSSRRIQIDAANSSYDTVLILYRYSGSNPSIYETCDHKNNGSELIDTTLGAGQYLLVVKGDKSTDEGDYEVTFRDMATVMNRITCDDNSAGSNQAYFTQYLNAGTYHLVLKSKSTSTGAYSVKVRDVDWGNSFGRINCNNDASGTSSILQQVLNPGDYWFLVTGYYYYEKGQYSLRVTDVTNPPGSGTAATCNDDTTGNTSTIVANGLAAGDYYVTLKGDASGDAGNYKLNVKDLSATASGVVIACDDDTGPDASSVIERNLNAGTYKVIVKGDAANDKGAYKVSVRDVTNKPYNTLQCDKDSGGSGTSYLERDLAAGNYYVTVKGDQALGSGAYNLALRDVTSVPTQAATCNDNGGTRSTSVFSSTLNPGTYYVGLKGKTGAAKGRYQLTVGGGTTNTTTKYVPPTWAQTLQALNDREVRVMSILSCHDDVAHGNLQGDCNELRDQALSLANSTDALGADLEPLVFDIDADGDGLSSTVVDGVASLAQYLEMNVQVVVVFAPDANPGFNVTIKAADEPGDGCDGLIGQEHQQCTPGATPKFVLQFENPLSHPVPLNPNEPMFGGYNFKAQLIGDGQFIVDEVPIYIIPEDVIMGPEPPPPPLYEMGEYWQDVPSPGCGGPGSNQRPDWRDFTWNAEVFTNTSISFLACAADTPEELETCVPVPVASITGGAACATSADCAEGWCDQNTGACQIASADTCTSDMDCPVNADCSNNTCVFDSQPVYVGGVLGEDNRKAFLRMFIRMGITDPYPEPPVIHSWQLTYYCGTVE